MPAQAEISYRVVEHDHDHAKAIAFNMLFMVWRRRTLTTPYRRGMQLVRELYARFPEGVGVCQVVEVDAVPPDSEVRRAFIEFFKVDGLKHFSVTHDGVGFKAASVRAITSGVHALARPNCKHSVHSSVGDAAAWHEKYQAELGRREKAAEIAKWVWDLRDFHRQQYPSEPPPR